MAEKLTKVDYVATGSDMVKNVYITKAVIMFDGNDPTYQVPVKDAGELSDMLSKLFKTAIRVDVHLPILHQDFRAYRKLKANSAYEVLLMIEAILKEDSDGKRVVFNVVDLVPFNVRNMKLYMLGY